MDQSEGNKILRCGVGQQWEAHRREIDIIARRVDKTYQALREVSMDTNSTAKLLADVSAVLKNIKDDLVGPATGRKQVPIWSHMLTVFFLGIIALVILIERSQKVIHFGATPLTPEVTIGNADKVEAMHDDPKS